MATDPTPPVWFSTADAAEQLGVTGRTVYAFANSGDLTGFKMGRVFRFRSTDLDAFLEGRRIQPGDLDHLLGGNGGGEPEPEGGAPR